MAEYPINAVPKDNRRVYLGFLGVAKWVILVIAIILILMAIFLT